jgi:hypothetical protein
VDRKPGAAVVPISQVIHPSSSSRVTLRDTSTRISVCINIDYIGSSLSNSTAKTTYTEEVSTRGRITRHLAFLPQQPIRIVRRPQLKEEAKDVSTVENKATRRRIAQRKQLSSS